MCSEYEKGLLYRSLDNIGVSQIIELWKRSENLAIGVVKGFDFNYNGGTGGADQAEELRGFLSVLPKDGMYAVEFRHKGWFTEETYELLRENCITMVQVEHPRLPTEDELTGDFAYIRWEGDRGQVDGEKGAVEIDRGGENLTWSRRIRAYLEEGLRVFGYFSKFYSGYPVYDIHTIMDNLEKSWV